jgi:hypothetical protein
MMKMASDTLSISLTNYFFIALFVIFIGRLNKTYTFNLLLQMGQDIVCIPKLYAYEKQTTIKKWSSKWSPLYPQIAAKYCFFCSFLTSFVIISLHWFPCVQVCSSTSSSSWPTATTPHPAVVFLTISCCKEQHCKHVWSLTGATTCSQGQ